MSLANNRSITSAMPSPLCFPRLQTIRLERFSLFKKKPNVSLDLQNGVTCLAGANGIGKSTLLSAVNFAITGVVPLQSRELKSVDEYYEDCLRFSRDFFTGRIDERDRKKAIISVHLAVGSLSFHVSRTFFDPGRIHELAVFDEGSNRRVQRYDGTKATAEERANQYKSLMTQAVGLSKFEQFVFLQHFVMTFDESRHLLFWDARALEPALYIAFGADYVDAVFAGKLRRDMERSDSRVRNLQFQATNVRKRLTVIQEWLAGGTERNDLDDLLNDHQTRLRERDEAASAAEGIEDKVRDTELKLADCSAQVATLRSEYSEEFSRHVRGATQVQHHPLVAAALTEGQCGICGRQGDGVSTKVGERLQRKECPLCGAVLTPREDKGASLARLREVDKRIAELKEHQDALLMARKRLQEELKTATTMATSADARLRRFEQDNRAVLDQLRNRLVTIDGRAATTVASLQNEIEALLAKKRQEQEKRDERRRELQLLQRKLEKSYAAVEADFVPLFRKLAELFLGMDVKVRTETKAAPQITLVLELVGSPRREQHQLSESQRFFVDIALRMALAQYMAGDAKGATLFVDTPEGSLDIAYESRVGEMFAGFVESGHNLIMTANINTSQLLLKLASQCGRNKMQLTRMTDWVELSGVQEKEEALFRRAYKAIEEALKKKHV
jgi:DNA repair exonuclease SbcCD ATPase subunit